MAVENGTVVHYFMECWACNRVWLAAVEYRNGEGVPEVVACPDCGEQNPT